MRRSDLKIVLPTLFWLYWSDFAAGPKAATIKSDIVKLILRHSSGPLRDAVEEVVRAQTKVTGQSSTSGSQQTGVVGVAAVVNAMSAEKARLNSQYKVWLFSRFFPLSVIRLELYSF